VTDASERHAYPADVRFEILEQDVRSYRRAAEFINVSDAEVVSLQHEFGIYGGLAGRHVLALLRGLRVPVVTHLHTVLERMRPSQRRVMEEIAQLSSRLVVMSHRARQILLHQLSVPDDRIDVIAHGIPDVPFVDPNFHKDQFGLEGRKVLLTFGLLNPLKGIEYVIRALPAIVEAFPDVMYVVLGATHPALVRREGERYRHQLEREAERLGVSAHVAFHNRFVELRDLRQFLGASDIYVTPYLNEAQVTSGALAYAFGCGKAVVSTPYWHAEELLANGRGVLVPFRDAPALAEAVIGLLGDEVRRHAMRKRAYLLGREMIWSRTAQGFLESFHRARLASASQRLAVRTRATSRGQLPDLRWAHLRRMTDEIGVLHHATECVPDWRHGYRTVDNALALRLAVLLEAGGDASATVGDQISTCAAFLQHAVQPGDGGVRVHLTFQRIWDDAAAGGTRLVASWPGRSVLPWPVRVLPVCSGGRPSFSGRWWPGLQTRRRSGPGPLA
jgi:glycosyltransferase involved in cell wall biosynthesis